MSLAPPMQRRPSLERLLSSQSQELQNEKPEDRTCTAPVKQFFRNNAGFLCMAFAQLGFVSTNMIVKQLSSTASHPLPTWFLIFVRMTVGYFACAILMRINHIPHPWFGPPEVRHLLALRGLCGSCAMYGLYYSIRYLSLSDATALTFLTPVATGLVAGATLGEHYGLYEALAGFCSLLGVILIAKPTILFHTQHHDSTVSVAARTGAIVFALAGVMGAATAYTLIRKMCTKIHALHSVAALCFMSCMVAIATPIVLPNQRTIIIREPITIFFIAFLAIVGFGAQYFLAKALQLERAARVTLANYLQLPFALLGGLLFFKEKPDLISLAGALVIVASAASTVLFKSKTCGEDEKGDLEREEENACASHITV